MKNIEEAKAKGQITIAAALSLALVFSLVAAVFRSVGVSALNVHIQQSCRLATEAVFSGYSNIILDEFDVLLLKKSDNINGKVRKYISDNLKSEKSAALVSAEFDQIDMVTDNGGENIRKEILAYMKYEVIPAAIKELTGSSEQIKKSENIKKVTGQINDCEESVYEMEEQVLKLIQLIEGIETNTSGLVIRNGKPQPVSDYFVKAAINGEVNMVSAAVDNLTVYESVNHAATYYTNIKELLENMYSDVIDLEAAGDEENNSMGDKSYSVTYKRSLDKLKALVDGTAKKTKEALKVVEQYKIFTAKAENDIENSRKTVEESRELIGGDLSEELLSDLTEMKTGASSTKRKLCDVSVIEEALKQRKLRLDNLKLS
ncbi:MAG: hypothetical protein Q4F11_05065, partial [Eubacteriales bacterium]|nr:hypothetical protein [Eubacteriales bacterium]